MSFNEEVSNEVIRIQQEAHKRPADYDVFKMGELAGAAACYLMHRVNIGDQSLSERVAVMVRDLWPWATYYWKPRSRREDLIHAAALIQLEVERLDRKTAGDLPRDYHPPVVKSK